LEGKSEHQTFFKKNGTSDIKTKFYGFDIRSTIIHINFYHKKTAKIRRQVFLICCQT